MFVIQCSQVFSNRGGRIVVSPDAGRLEGGVGERPRPDEPLGLEARLHDVVAALAATDDHLVGLLAGEVAAWPRGPRRSAARASYRSRPSYGVPVPATRASSSRIVGAARPWRSPVSWSSWSWAGVIFTAPVPKAGSTTRVRDDRHVALDERDPDAPPDERGVARVVGMDGDGGVAEDRLGPGGGDRDRGVRDPARPSPRRSGGSGPATGSRSPASG